MVPIVSDCSSLILNDPLPLTVHPAAVYLRSLSPGSRSTMEQSLNTIASLLTDGQCDLYTLNWGAILYQHTAAVQAALLENYAPATASKMMCAFRRVLKEAKKLGLMSATNYETAIELPSIKESRSLRGRALSGEEIKALIQVCLFDPTPWGNRDLALIAILRGTGLRRAEVVNLELKDYDPLTGAIYVRGGKNGVDRKVYLPYDAISWVNDWLDNRGNDPGALLLPIKLSGGLVARHMTPQAVLVIIQKRAHQAGVKSFSPHDFRRTFCSDLLDAGVDIVTVSKLAGHASPTTTAKYDRRGDETLKKAVQKLRFD